MKLHGIVVAFLNILFIFSIMARGTRHFKRPLVLVREHVINEHLSVGMTKEGSIGVLIDGEWVAQCRHALLEIFDENDASFVTMDDAIDALDKRESNDERIKFTRDTEFLAHASNIQAWAEHEYDPRLLHSNLASSILLMLSKKDENIKRKMEGEMTERFILTPDDHKAWFFYNYSFFLANDVLFPAICKAIFDDETLLENAQIVTDFLDRCVEKGIEREKVMAFAINHAGSIVLHRDTSFIKGARWNEMKELLRGIQVKHFIWYYYAHMHEPGEFGRIYRAGKIWARHVMEYIRLHVDDLIVYYMKKTSDQFRYMGSMERPMFIVALEQCRDLRALFTKKDWAYLVDLYEKNDKNISTFLNDAFFLPRVRRWNEEKERAGKEIFGKEWIIADRIRDDTYNSAVISPELDYPAYLWSMGWFKKTRHTSIRFPGATHLYHGYIMDNGSTRRYIIYRIVDDDGKIAYTTWLSSKIT